MLPDRSCRRRKIWIGESTNGNCDQARACIALAIYGRPAFRTKMQPKFAALLAVAEVDFTWSLSMDLRFREERVNEKCRSCSSLTFGAITNMDKDGFAVCLCPQRAAGTLSNSGHVGLPPDLPIASCDPMIGRSPHDVECSSVSSSALNRSQKTRRLSPGCTRRDHTASRCSGNEAPPLFARPRSIIAARLVPCRVGFTPKAAAAVAD